MAIKQSTSIVAHATLSKRIVMDALILSFFGWLILLAWSFWLWGCRDFFVACQSLQQLSNQQLGLIGEYEDNLFVTTVKKQMVPAFQKVGDPLMQQARGVGSNLGHLAQKPWQMLSEDQTLVIDSSFKQLIDEFQDGLTKGWFLMKGCGHVLLVKLMILVTALPLFLLAIAAGLVDGLNQRAIRTASLGRESTYVFHKSIPLMRKTVFWVLGLWLAIPFPLSPSLVFVSLSVLLSLVVSMSASRFKKYL